MPLVLLVFAFVLFVVGAVVALIRPAPDRFWAALIAAGLACWVAASLFVPHAGAILAPVVIR